jgi:hypothetical protein
MLHVTNGAHKEILCFVAEILYLLEQMALAFTLYFFKLLNFVIRPELTGHFVVLDFKRERYSKQLLCL